MFSSDPWPESPLINRLLRKLVPVLVYTKARQFCRNLLSAFLACFLKTEGQAVVLTGPFSGMRYATRPTFGSYLPQLLGTYEKELSDVLTFIVRQNYETIIDIGSAEGYYAVGFLRASPSTRLYAFDISADAQQVCKHLAKLNSVDRRLVISGGCNLLGLEGAIKGKTLVFADCEGAEVDLLQPQKCPRLHECDILVELHAFINSLAMGVPGRFLQTHSCLLIDARPRTLDDFPLRDIKWPSYLKMFAINEFRPAGMKWAWLQARPKILL